MSGLAAHIRKVVHMRDPTNSSRRETAPESRAALEPVGAGVP